MRNSGLPPRAKPSTRSVAARRTAHIETPGVATRLTAEEEQAALRVLREGPTWATGPQADAFEREFNAFIGARGALAVNSCTSALELAAVLSGLRPEHEVILPAHTFVASAVPFARTGAHVRWADIDPASGVLSAATIEPLLTKRTRVVVVVHLFGLPVDLDPIMELAEQHGFLVVEDCAQAPGARYNGRRVGSMGHFGCFSFHSSKIISTLGEGGMLTTRDPEDAVRARRLRWMGIWPFPADRAHYWLPATSNVVEPIPGCWPFNYCIGEPSCAVGRLLLRRLDSINERRREMARRFIAALSAYPELTFQRCAPSCEHVYSILSAQYDGSRHGTSRDELIDRLHNAYRLKCTVQYWPLHRTELFQKLGPAEARVPATDCYYERAVSFPWASEFSDALIDEMARRVRACLDELRAGR